ncbi:hypothetical protein NL676_036253 [Syzygium grande]|nr:hypothetical protein NL676_036253 [Syzygium grande]
MGEAGAAVRSAGQVSVHARRGAARHCDCELLRAQWQRRWRFGGLAVGTTVWRLDSAGRADSGKAAFLAPRRRAKAAEGGMAVDGRRSWAEENGRMAT